MSIYDRPSVVLSLRRRLLFRGASATVFVVVTLLVSVAKFRFLLLSTQDSSCCSQHDSLRPCGVTRPPVQYTVRSNLERADSGQEYVSSSAKVRG